MPFNSIFSWLIKKRMHQIELFTKYPLEVQEELMSKLITTAKDTEWGKKHGYASIDSYEKFKNRFPIQDYDDIKPFVDRIFNGEQNLLWPTEIKWFAKSSGTTSDKYKLIPVSKETLEECHYKGGKDLLCLYYQNHPNRKLYKGKHLIIGGSAQIHNITSDSYFGDLSAIIIKNLPFWAEIRRIPKKEIALLDKWDEKIEQMAASSIKEDVYIVAGVPSWTLLLFKRILEITGKDNIADVWPNLELFMHGGVSFIPYKEQFKQLIRKPGMNYVETYNASEGFFGIQDQVDKDEMLLMLDYGIFYEFITLEDFQQGNTNNTIWLDHVKPNVNYVMIISTNSGLWRYVLGDTITFTTINPFRFKITGRTKHFINAFGEEIIIDNAEKAINTACERTGAKIKEYTASPVFMSDKKTGAHQWLIEFDQQPNNLLFFGEVLDNALKALNSDYEAKRSHNFIMQLPVITVARPNLFYDWLKAKGKLGGQNKIPRLLNNRELMDDLLQLNK
jgi:hypothetical protein